MTRNVLTAIWVAVLLHATHSSAGAAAPDFARWMNVGRAHLENRNSAKAIEAFTAALKLEPKSPPALRNLARAQLLANQNDQALQSLTEARSLERDSAATSYLLGLAHARPALGSRGRQALRAPLHDRLRAL